MPRHDPIKRSFGRPFVAARIASSIQRLGWVVQPVSQRIRIRGPRTILVQINHPATPPRAAHHGCGLSRDVTTKSVRSVPHCEQRNRSSVSGTSPRPNSTIAARSASAWWRQELQKIARVRPNQRATS